MYSSVVERCPDKTEVLGPIPSTRTMILYVVATPIGNLKDISLRGREVLTQATLIIAEDTRTTGKLLKLLGIEGEREFLSSHAQSTEKELTKSLERCLDHEIIALVTDAGTPAISDPGANFINAFRSKFVEAQILPIPGPSALISAISVSGFKGNHFEFLGFLPHKKGRQTIFNSLKDKEHIVAFFESPHRILRTLESLTEVLGGREMLVAREITKQFEEYKTGTTQDLLDYYLNHADKVKGEFVVVIAPLYQ